MTDLSASTQPTPPSGSPAYDDRMIAGITYVLFLLLPTFFPVLIGLVLAYANRDTPSAMLRSHYVFQIRSFWMFFGWALIALAMIGVEGGIFGRVRTTNEVVEAIRQARDIE